MIDGKSSWHSPDTNEGVADHQVSVSVLIATRNRAHALDRLLRRLSSQRCAGGFEAVVADNGSRDETKAVVERASSFLTIRYVYVEEPGKGRALNQAITRARGDLLVFTDDDVLPDTGWLAAMQEAARSNPDCNVFGGRISIDPLLVPAWIRRSYNLMGLLTSAHDKGEIEVRYGHGDYPFGPNMAIRRSIVQRCEGRYPQHLGPGTDLPVGDETHFFMQFSPAAANDRLFVPSASVVHEVEVENVRFKSALLRCYQAGRAHGSLPGSPVGPGLSKGDSRIALIGQRVAACRSLREFVCVVVRYLGFMRERRELPR